jgi:hypothetical protein
VRDGPPAHPRRRRGRRPERRVSKRLQAETIERLVAEYRTGSTAADLGRRYGLAKTTVLRLIRQAGERVRHPRLSVAETGRLVELYEAGLPQRILPNSWAEARARSGTASGGPDWCEPATNGSGRARASAWPSSWISAAVRCGSSSVSLRRLALLGSVDVRDAVGVLVGGFGLLDASVYPVADQ